MFDGKFTGIPTPTSCSGGRLRYLKASKLRTKTTAASYVSGGLINMMSNEIVTLSSSIGPPSNLAT